MSSAFHKLLSLVKCDREETREPIVTHLQLEITTPFVPYKRSVIEEIPKELVPVEDEPPTQIVQGIIEPPQDEMQNNNATEEITISSNTNDD